MIATGWLYYNKIGHDTACLMRIGILILFQRLTLNAFWNKKFSQIFILNIIYI